MGSLEPEGGDSATIWRYPNDLELELHASSQLLTPPLPRNLDPVMQSEPL